MSLLNIGLIFFNNGNFDKALEYGQRVVNIDPDNFLVWNNIGSVFYELGQYVKATYYYKRAIFLNPDESSPYVNLGKHILN